MASNKASQSRGPRTPASDTARRELPLKAIRRLVGEIPSSAFEVVDYALSEHLGLFVPVGGQCCYAATPDHTHPSYSFIVSFDDFCKVRVDGRVEHSRPGTFAAFSPGVPHQELPQGKPPRYVAILVAPAYLRRQLTDYRRTLPELRGATFATTSRMVDALREFMSEFESKLPGQATLLEVTAQKLTHLIIRQILGYSQQDETVNVRMAANRTVEFMHGHLHEKLTLKDMARVGRLSISQFSRTFKEELGLPPMEYLQELRLLRARRQLRDSNQSISEIAIDLGFSSASYFSRCFAKRFSISPSHFRNAHGR